MPDISLIQRLLLIVFLLPGCGALSPLLADPPESEPSPQQRLARLPEFMERGMADWGIPGMAVAVVQGDEVVYTRGFGYTRLGSGERVDEHTVFAMASLTKAMTAAALGILVDEGKLHWDDRVRDHLPWFRLSDPWVTEEVRIRDLLSHQVGIGRLTGNRLRFMPGRDPQTIMSFVRHMPFEASFRSAYVYSNIMYMVAGQVLEAVSGVPWDQFMAERLFTPMGMTRTGTSISQLAGMDNVSWPHQEIDGEVQVIQRRCFDNVGPAASVNASVHDMARWMILQLGEPGVYEGERIISRESLLETHQPQQVFRLDDPLGDQLTGYALGWGLRHYEGYRVSQHSGATDGMTSFLVLMPEKELGVLVVSNLFCNFRPAVVRYILDAMIGIQREKDWHTHFFTEYLELREETLARRAELEGLRQPDRAHSLPLSGYAGLFTHPVYDNAEVRIDQGGQLVLQLWDDPGMIADLEHWHYDTFRAHWRNRAMREKFIAFDMDETGAVSHLNIHFTLRQILISVGIYPADYTREVRYSRQPQ